MTHNLKTHNLNCFYCTCYIVWFFSAIILGWVSIAIATFICYKNYKINLQRKQLIKTIFNSVLTQDGR